MIYSNLWRKFFIVPLAYCHYWQWYKLLYISRWFPSLGDKQNTSDNVLTIMFDQLLTRETDLPPNYFDGLTRVCREKKYAFMTLDNMASVLQGKVECALEPLDVIMQTTIAMAVPADSPYHGIINSKWVRR